MTGVSTIVNQLADMPLSMLIVDDNYWQLNLHQHLMERSGYQVNTAATAKTAWKSIVANQPAIMILDRHLPDQDGSDLCRQVKTVFPETLVLMCSGVKISETDRIGGFEAGADDYLTKPVSPKELLARVRALARIWEVQQKLKASEQQFRLLIENVHDLIGRVNADGRVLYISPASHDLLGVAPAAIVGTSIYDWIHPDQQPVVYERSQQAYTETGCPAFECQARNEAGDAIWLEVTLRAVADQDDLIFIARDIGQRKQYGEQLELLSSALTATAHPVLILDRKRQIEWVNPAFTTLTGYTAAEAIGQTPDLLRSNRHSAAFFQQIWQTIESGAPWRGEIINRRKSGEEYVEETAITPLIDGAGKVTHFIEIKQDVTTAREAQRAQAESEARYRNLVENLPDMVFRYDPQGRHVYVSPNTAALFGRPPATFIGKTHHELGFAPEVADYCQARIRAVIDTGQPQEEDCTYENERGRFYLNWRLVPEFDAKHEVTAVLGIGRDLTQHRQDETEIARLAALVDQATEAKLVVGQEGHILYANACFTNLIGWSRDDVLQQPLSKLADQIPGANLSEIVRQALVDKAIWQGQLTLHCLDDRQLILDTDVFPIIEAADRPPSVGLVMRDVTESVKLQREQAAVARVASALRQSSTYTEILTVILNELLQIVAGQGAALVQLDRESNAAAVELAIGDPLFSSDQWLAFLAHLTQTIPFGSQPFALEAVRSLPDPAVANLPGTIDAVAGLPLLIQDQQLGTLWVGRAAPFHQHEIQLLAAVADIAANALYRALLFNQVEQQADELARRVAERTAALNIANSQLRRTMRSRDRFLANMSHELRTPLSSILLRTDLLQKALYGRLNEKQAHSVDIIRSSGQHLLSLINDVLDMAKIEAGKLTLDIEMLSIPKICHASLELIQEQAKEKQQELSLDIAPEIEEMEADPRRLKQILVNLLSNAVKFTPDGGQVSLRVRSEANHNAVAFTVSDTGIGIPLSDIPRLFDPFVQLDNDLNRKYEGTGLGLPLVRQLVDSHGGGMHIDSVVNKGTEVTVKLPWKQGGKMNQKSSYPALPLASSQPNGANSRKKILIADDNEHTVEALQEYMSYLGYEVALARNGLEVLEQIGQILPDLVLMDIHMPDMDGLQAIRRIRQNGAITAGIPIVALTALAMPGDRERCLKAGATEYLTKPFALHELTELICVLAKTVHAVPA